jgi:hypothetical protein
MLNEEKYNPHALIKEWPALSVVKFICVSVMIFVHAHMMLVTKSYAFTDTSGFFYKVTSNWMFIGLFLFTLPIIAGAIFRMDLSEYIVGEKLKSYSFKKTISIAIFLALAGFFMNIMTAGMQYVFSWNVLQLIGLSFIVIVALLKVSSIRVVFLAGLTALFLAEPLRNFLNSSADFYLVGVLIGGSKGFMFWPFFPWFSVIVFGFLMAHYYLKYQDSNKFRISAIAMGVSFLAIAIFRGEISPYLNPEYVWGSSLFQPRIGLVLAAMGLFAVMTIGANYFFNGLHLKKYGIINSYSKGILWIYVIQMFVSYQLSLLIKGFFPMDKPSLVYFIFIVGMLLFCWLIGALSIKLLQEKLIVVRLKKV